MPFRSSSDLAVIAATCLLFANSIRADEKAEPPKPKPPAVESNIPDSLRKPLPENLQDLLAIQKRVQSVVSTVTKATVNVRVGGGQGSGVIVSKDGYVLTAAHVSGEPGKPVTIVFPDGKSVAARSLGLNHASDAGLVKISQKGDWPFVDMGKDLSVKTGDWCVALGHPGGWERGRPPVVRLGRVVSKTETMLQSDCTLVGGDSGGPLFDLEGKVIAIHSRIGPSNKLNLHVPIDRFHDEWAKFVKDENLNVPPAAGGPIMGVRGEDDPDGGALITEVAPGLPAEAGGIKADDVITKFDGKSVKGFRGLYDLVQKKKAGDKVEVELRRDGKKLTKTVTLGKRN